MDFLRSFRAPDPKLLIGSFKSIFAPHYIVNVFLACSFYVLKTVPPICEYMFEDCSIELKHWEWLTFLGCIIVLKNKKQASMQEYISTACLFSKTLNIVMYFQYNVAYAAAYALICLLHFVFIPQPVYDGPEFITYFRGPHLKNEIARDKRNTWVICFYAAWSPSCVTVAPTFAEISNEYHLDNLKFGKLDVSRYADVAEETCHRSKDVSSGHTAASEPIFLLACWSELRYKKLTTDEDKHRIDTSSFSKQLPTLILFQDGKEKTRRPPISAKGTVVKYSFTKEKIINDFEMNEVYNQCKKTLPKQHKEKQDEKKTN